MSLKVLRPALTYGPYYKAFPKKIKNALYVATCTLTGLAKDEHPAVYSAWKKQARTRNILISVHNAPHSLTATRCRASRTTAHITRQGLT